MAALSTGRAFHRPCYPLAASISSPYISRRYHAGTAAAPLLAGKRALVTGGTSGIGLGVARAFMEHGADVAVTHFSGADAVRADDLSAYANQLGRRCLSVRADVSDPVDVDRLITTVEDGFGRIDILVNNAGQFNLTVDGANEHKGKAGAWGTPVHEMSVAAWDQLIAVNLRSIFLVTRRVLPAMLERADGGRIINTASELAIKGGPNCAAYAAAKAGVITFTRCLAQEIGDKNVTVNVVAPGLTHTPMTEPMMLQAKEAAKTGAFGPRNQVGEVDDIVPAFLFLASPGARHMLGQTMCLSGGEVFV